MKLSKLNIESFRHLENLDFDFTYPKDYKDATKAGKPLEKICFIGQSATGKTGLLELIFEYNLYLLTLEVVNSKYLTSMRQESKNVNGEIDFVANNVNYKLKNDEVFFLNRKLTYQNVGGEVRDLISTNEKNNVLYFKSDLISNTNIELFSKNPIELIEKYAVDLISVENVHKFFTKDKIYGLIFDANVESKIWLYLLNEILKYRKNFTQKMSELIHKGLLANQKKLSDEFNKWQKDNPNSLELFASKFNPILKKLNLEVDLVDTGFSIPIKNKINDEIIPIQNTSTGTKGLLLSFLPLYKLDTKDSIILIDEPERSLYPDVQMELMEHYQNLAPDAQFIVATHSPFIAASFEPEERFILYFDEKGKVAVRRGSSPIGDDPNDMLYNDFGVNYYNSFGKAAYKKYLELKEDLSKEKDPAKKKKLLLETVQLGDTYNF